MCLNLDSTCLKWNLMFRSNLFSSVLIFLSIIHLVSHEVIFWFPSFPHPTSNLSVDAVNSHSNYKLFKCNKTCPDLGLPNLYSLLPSLSTGHLLFSLVSATVPPPPWGPHWPHGSPITLHLWFLFVFFLDHTRLVICLISCLSFFGKSLTGGMASDLFSIVFLACMVVTDTLQEVTQVFLKQILLFIYFRFLVII